VIAAMKATAVFAAEKDTVRVQEFSLDEGELQPDFLLVETKHSLISPGTELACLAGSETSWFRFPQQLGYCAVGEVLAVGVEVSECKVGDVVLTLSPHASHARVHREQIRAKVPAEADSKLAVFAHLAFVSMTALRVSSAELGDRVAVIGQGLIGNLAAQLFQAQGSQVIGIDRLASRLETARRSGIASLVDASAEDSVAAVKKLTEGRGAEVVVEATGLPSAALQGMQMAAPNGELVLLGTPRGSCELDIVPLLRAAHNATPNVTVRGAHVYSAPELGNAYVKHSMERNARICLELAAQGKLRFEPLLSRVAKPSEAPQIYRALKENPEELMGVVFDWSG